MELLPFGNKPTHIQNAPKIVLLLAFTLCVTVVVPLCYSLLSPAFLWSVLSPNSSPSSSPLKNSGSQRMNKWEHEKCDLFTGKWVPNPEAPYYTNMTCWAIHNHQNCMKYGRPDNDFMKWRWKPDGCELPIFDPFRFLELVRGKSMVFLGDSVGRNQMLSLICLLSRVEYPIDVSYTSDDKSRRWLYASYNFTVANYWSPFLVRAKDIDPSRPSPSGLFCLYLDEYDEDWTTRIDDFDYLIISAGHWFFRPTIFYENGQIMGCHYCQKQNITDLTMYYSYRRAFRTAFQAINGAEKFKGMTFLRTFSSSHFENGLWNQGGDCVRTKPFKSNETRLEGINLEFYMIQVEEFKKAKEEGKKRGLNFELLDTTEAMLLRPDGHPSRYGHWPNDNVIMPNDCVLWCLPGPVDTWNDFLLQMLKMEAGGHGMIRNNNRISGRIE